MSKVVYSFKLETESEPDRRYRMMVLLNRSDRPTHMKFHCPRCTMPVGEIINSEIVAITDAMDISNIDVVGAGVRCDGRYNGRRCNVWYYFTLGAK